jgi:two-component system, sensor histidine kinase and response regulator
VVNLECRDYDLLICDIKMPEMDGFEVVQKIRNWCWNPQVPVIILSAESDPQSIARGAALGASAYMTKPFNAEELANTARAFLK